MARRRRSQSPSNWRAGAGEVSGPVRCPGCVDARRPGARYDGRARLAGVAPWAGGLLRLGTFGLREWWRRSCPGM